MQTDPLFDFSGKVALVTGGSRGLGRQMVLALAARGADVIIASRKIDACQAVAAEVEGLGRRALPIAAHTGKWADCDHLMEAAYAAFGRVDILVNNAGMSPACPSHDVSEALFDSVLNLNFKGPFRLASQIAQRMATSNGGSILNISSIASLRATPGVVPYAGAKAALNALTHALPRDLPPGVKINAVCPGWVATRMGGASAPLTPEEGADTALWLALLPEDGPTGGFFRRRQPIAW